MFYTQEKADAMDKICAPHKLCIKNGLIHTVAEKEPFKGDILAVDGKISEIGTCLEVTEDTVIIDATGLEVYPGFVEAHCHTGLDGYGVGYEGRDYCELNDLVTPQLRGIDGINPMDPCFEHARNAGVTCLATGPGSADVLGGTFAAVKTIGKRIDKMIVKNPVAMKCAFGENPKNCYQDKGDTSRMTTASLLRNELFKAKAYMEKKEAAGNDVLKRPEFNLKLESLIPVLKHEIPLKAHAHQANDIFTAIRIAKEFGVGLTLEHVTEGHLIALDLAGEPVPMAVGPTLGHATKFELQNKSWTTPGILAKNGCLVSIITDAPVIPQEYLALCAGLAVKAGMDEYEALKAITINPAKHLGIEDRVGTLEKGKDADIVITDGNPMVVETTVKYVFIDGALVHQE